MGAAALLAFFVTTPYAVFANEEFTADLQYEWQHHKIIGHVGAEGNSGQWLAEQLLTRSDRWLTVLAVAGIVLAAWRRQWAVLLVSSFTVVYFLNMSANLVRFERFLVPIIPTLAVSAGYFGIELVRWGGKRPWLLPVLLLLLLSEPIISVAQFDNQLAQTEARTLARDWIRDNIPATSMLATERYAPNLDGAGYEIRRITSLNEHPPEWYRQQGFDYLIFAEAQYAIPWRDPAQYADLITAYEVLWDNFELVAEFDGPYVGRPHHNVLIYQVTP
jgi:hypothetical protein